MRHNYDELVNLLISQGVVILMAWMQRKSKTDSKVIRTEKECRYTYQNQL